ncbi:Fic family protein [Ruminiclostridium herbifermentans]|uniref:Fic family protein n=1 Tax=Ruminiclostridium herbifermentans TaxID=2488810 RepID=A0A4U7JJM1_9FIRM|nr:Fic family protein [Ruminiclostridium herbifermentans]QNU66267.1 Fic family protein [Ruminiclostridium herbifermentans]
MDFKRILEKQKLYEEGKDTLHEVTIESYNNAFEVEFTHNSTAIEGNTLTLMETKVVLEDGISIGGKTLREIYEVVNHQKAFRYVKQCINEGLPLSEKIVKDIHALVTENIIVGGIYRNEEVFISGASHTPPARNEMYIQIKNFFADLMYKKDLNPIELAAWTHAEFVRIHPFLDGNGRTARLIMNYQLMSYGFLPISIAKENRLDYYNALDKYAVQGILDDFVNMIAELEEAQLDKYISIIQEQNQSHQIQQM